MSQGPVGNRHGARVIRCAGVSHNVLEDQMRCPFCKNEDTKVIDSRVADEGQAIRRRRSCGECGRRFSTVESAVLSVVKRNGVSEPFSREKVMRGVRRACQGRQVNEDALAQLAAQVEDSVRASGLAEIPSDEVGLAILGPLRDLDEVAYLRFASVYRSFDSLADFQREIDDLRGDGDHTDGDADSHSAVTGSNAAGSNAVESDATAGSNPAESASGQRSRSAEPVQ
ncbi:hypothetical protein GCM10009624_09980 [Gordonia sinesedis]